MSPQVYISYQTVNPKSSVKSNSKIIIFMFLMIYEMGFMFKYSSVFDKCCLLLCVILPVVGCRVSAERPVNTTQTSADMTASHCRMSQIIEHIKRKQPFIKDYGSKKHGQKTRISLNLGLKAFVRQFSWGNPLRWALCSLFCLWTQLILTSCRRLVPIC